MPIDSCALSDVLSLQSMARQREKVSKGSDVLFCTSAQSSREVPKRKVLSNGRCNPIGGPKDSVAARFCPVFALAEALRNHFCQKFCQRPVTKSRWAAFFLCFWVLLGPLRRHLIHDQQAAWLSKWSH